MVSGEELLTLDDAVLPGPLSFRWTRTYRSGHRRDIGLGLSWTHSGSEQLHVAANQIDYYDNEGRIIPLARPRVGQPSHYLPEGITLEHPDSTHFILKQAGQPDKVFERLGASGVYRLRQLRHAGYRDSSIASSMDTHPASTDTHPTRGFAIHFSYNAHNRLQRIAGNWGLALVLTWDYSPGTGTAT